MVIKQPHLGVDIYVCSRHSCLAVKVACGGFHTLAVVRHDPREAGEDAARRGVRQWAKPKPELTVGEPTEALFP